MFHLSPFVIFVSFVMFVNNLNIHVKQKITIEIKIISVMVANMKTKPDTVTIAFRVPVAIRERMEQIVAAEHRTLSVQSFLFFQRGLEEYESRIRSESLPPAG